MIGREPDPRAIAPPMGVSVKWEKDRRTTLISGVFA